MGDFTRICKLRYVCGDTGETLHEEPVFQEAFPLPTINAWILIKGFPCTVDLIEAKDEEPEVAVIRCVRVKKPEDPCTPR